MGAVKKAELERRLNQIHRSGRRRNAWPPEPGELTGEGTMLIASGTEKVDLSGIFSEIFADPRSLK